MRRCKMVCLNSRRKMRIARQKRKLARREAPQRLWIYARENFHPFTFYFLARVPYVRTTDKHQKYGLLLSLWGQKPSEYLAREQKFFGECNGKASKPQTPDGKPVFKVCFTERKKAWIIYCINVKRTIFMASSVLSDFFWTCDAMTRSRY